jgi:hypothetical protein
MIRALILLHRWLGVAFCLLFAMWFASGIVMHFVPYPAFSAAERRAGLTSIDVARIKSSPAQALTAASSGDPARVRLTQRSDGPIYVIAGALRTVALYASDLSVATVTSAELALAIAADYARRRQWDSAAAGIAALQEYDQWTLSGEFDRYRPLYRVAVNDPAGTDIYVSTPTGEIVLVTTRSQRTWNYAGSIVHWIYFTALRSHPAAWSRLLWWLSLLALIGAALGACIGILRIEMRGSRLVSPYAGLKAWHHWLGLGCMVFVLAWIFSGWLSMDDGTLFSSGRPSYAEIRAVSGAPDWSLVPYGEAQPLDTQTREAEWFAFGGHVYRRQIRAHDDQWLAVADAPTDPPAPQQAVLDPEAINSAARLLAPGCAAAIPIGRDQTDAATPIYRVICADTWFDIDPASGTLVEKFDASRRRYGWLFGRLHRLDFPYLTRHPALRTGLIVALCGCGFIFSLTGVVIGWQSLRRRPHAAG